VGSSSRLFQGAKIDLSGGASAPPPTVGYGGGTGSGGYSYGGGEMTCGGRAVEAGFAHRIYP